MQLMRTIPFYMLLLAACSAPPPGALSDAVLFQPGPHCQGDCATGYRFAVEQRLPDAARCRGEGEFNRGCKEAVDFINPFIQ